MNKLLHGQKVRRHPLLALILALSLVAQSSEGALFNIKIKECAHTLENINNPKLKKTRSPKPTKLKVDEVNDLLKKFNSDSQSFKPFEDDLRERLTQGTYKPEEVFAAALYMNKLNEEEWKKFEAAGKNIYIGWNNQFFARYSGEQRSRVIATRSINPLSKGYTIFLPSSVPLQTDALIISLFSEPSSDYDRVMKSTMDAVAKVIQGQNRLYVLQRSFYNTIALPLTGWEFFRYGVLRTQKFFTINKSAPALVWDRLYIRMFIHDPVTREQLLEATKWYLEDPQRLSEAAPQLSDAQRKILSEKGLDGFMDYMVRNMGNREALQFFLRTFPWVLALSSFISGVISSHTGGAGQGMNGTNNESTSTACVPTLEQKEQNDAAIKGSHFSPFDDVFTQKIESINPQNNPMNPCDPTGKMGREHMKLKMLYPDDPASYPYTDEAYQNWEKSPQGKKELEYYREKIRKLYFAPNSSCRIHYAEVMDCGKSL